jgi:hypothetical protein
MKSRIRGGLTSASEPRAWADAAYVGLGEKAGNLLAYVVGSCSSSLRSEPGQIEKHPRRAHLLLSALA